MRRVDIERVEEMQTDDTVRPFAERGEHSMLSRRAALLSAVRVAAAAGVAGAVSLRPARASAQDPGDAMALNALLAMEYATVAAYAACAPLLAAPASGDPRAADAPMVLALATRFTSQHGDQATQLAAVITAAGGTPVDPATVSFDFPGDFTPSVTNVIRLAANTEQAAAVAYGVATGTLSVDDNSGLAASIGGVHAQQYTVLALLAEQIIVATGTTATDVTDVVPTSFVASPTAGVVGLEATPDFAYD